MNETENLLKNINEKIRNRNRFTWKNISGLLTSSPFIFIGIKILENAKTCFQVSPQNICHSDADYEIIGIIIILTGTLWLLINFTSALRALYRSQKDI